MEQMNPLLKLSKEIKDLCPIYHNEVYISYQNSSQIYILLSVFYNEERIKISQHLTIDELEESNIDLMQLHCDKLLEWFKHDYSEVIEQCQQYLG